MYYFRLLIGGVFAFVAGPAVALSCAMSTFEEVATLPNTDENMMVLGEVDADFVFRGVIVGGEGPDTPVQLKMVARFRGPPHPIWGGPVLPVDRLVLGPVFREGDDMFTFLGSMCSLMVWGGTDAALIARVRQCQRDGVCPE